jgi:sugar lactone lactonase YvrE
VYLNDGKGRFTSGPRIGTSSIENVALADFDGDGDLDVFLACIGPDEVWLNDGRTVFADSTLRLGTAWSWQLAVGDVNGDRLPDVFVVNFTNDRTLPPDRALVAHPADVWLNASRRAPAPGVASGSAGGPTPTSVTRASRYAEDLQQARAAVAGKDHPTALAAYERLIRQAPYHPGLHYQVARLSAMTGQGARAVSELEKALALGYDFGEKLDDALAALGPETAAPKIAGLIQQTRRPVGASQVAFTIAQRDLTPEGIAYDPKDGAFYLGSTWRSKIVRLDAAGRLREFAAERQDGLRAVLGLRIDAARRTLWAVSVPNPLVPQRDPSEEGTAAVFRYSLATGRLTGNFELREAGVRHILNDLDVSPRGDVFVTDSLSGAIYTIRSGGTGLELLLGSGDLLQPNGIAMSADGGAIYVACTDGIYRVDIEAKTARRLGQPEDVCLGGIDGLYRADGGLIGIQNGLGFRRVVRIFLNRTGDTAEQLVVLENRNPRFELPTTGAVAGRSFFYMANTQIYRTGADGQLLPPEKLDDVIVLRLDVDSPAAATK